MSHRKHLGPWLRVFLCATLAGVFCGCASLSARTGSGRLTGTLWWLTREDLSLSDGDWKEELDYVQALGMDTVIFNGPYAGPDGGSSFDALLERLDGRGMHVYLDTLAPSKWWTLNHGDEEVKRACTRAALLEQRYGHHRSFVGFYIPYECYVMWGAQRELVTRLYTDISRWCKTIAPNKKVMISPFFILDEAGYLGDFRWATPKEYEDFWRSILTEASIDIVALQDSGEHLACYTLEQRRPFFEAMERACNASGATLWGNVESGELNVASLEEYVRRFGLKTYVNSPETTPFWRAVPAEKFAAKLAFVGEYTHCAITWGYREFLRPSRDTTAAEAYLNYVRTLGG